jgi:hypothetical protein
MTKSGPSRTLAAAAEIGRGYHLLSDVWRRSSTGEFQGNDKTILQPDTDLH